jgi:alkanesulfonate monooxygenase SsuD/methylene tetrahydromethanopterin reductase-like flavin-dependent oxidoreductase (luciferase family)
VPQAELYRARFRPSRWLDAPYLTVATWTIAAETTEQAERLAMPARMMFAHLVKGELIAVPSVETAEAWCKDHAPPSRNRRQVLGDAAGVRQQLEEVRALYGAQEMMLVNIMPDHAARVESYRLVASAFGLAQSAPGH